MMAGWYPAETPQGVAGNQQKRPATAPPATGQAQAKTNKDNHRRERTMTYKVRVHDELWQDNETGEVVTATQAIKEHYKHNDALSRWTDYYTFTGLYSDTTLDAPDFSATINR
jgi:hypothetical protein